MNRFRRRLHDNGLSIVLLSCFALFWFGQAFAGYRNDRAERIEHNEPLISLSRYVRSPEFVEATAENWESEFLQMAAFVWLTSFLFQRGSAESRDPDRTEETGHEPNPHRHNAPWPVRRGGLALLVYRHSLVLVLFALFIASFALHAYGGARAYAAEQEEHGITERMNTLRYIGTSRFWFESLQNWQSEFLAVLSIVLLSVVLRQHGSPESKRVDAPHGQTGK